MIVYYEKQVPNLYDGDLEDEDEILKWLLSQLENDEIEDVTDEMLDKLIKEGNEMLVLFCEFHSLFYLLYLSQPGHCSATPLVPPYPLSPLSRRQQR